MRRNSKFGWSLPPGAANDPSAPYNQPAPQPHGKGEHEWEFVANDFDDLQLEIVYMCGLPECDEHRRDVFEPETVLVDGEQIECRDRYEEPARHVLEEVEQKVQENEQLHLIEYDPDRHCGHVRVETKRYAVIYEP